MLWFVLCSVPGWVIAFGLWLSGAPLWLEWGVLASIAFGLFGSIFIQADLRRRRNRHRRRLR